ncbi:hypothetical protein N656DRAFT_24351 [Canariomyces notabilis]|uniref:Uncharacterized protein n=1 Tax=Canariomyces notabilis TaxID=2074819 RepID=A0AAN6TMM5_9PEZI|nr:hypothetical protein N656DRAFT_24351 [Canariomyces arenarius]
MLSPGLLAAAIYPIFPKGERLECHGSPSPQSSGLQFAEFSPASLPWLIVLCSPEPPNGEDHAHMPFSELTLCRRPSVFCLAVTAQAVLGILASQRDSPWQEVSGPRSHPVVSAL